VPVSAASFALFLDLCNFAARRHLAVATDDATAAESGEAEKPNETHDALRFFAEQFMCRRAGNDCALDAVHISARIARRMSASQPCALLARSSR
jgi:hypothetical protein